MRVERNTHLKCSLPELFPCHPPERFDIADEAVVFVDHFHIICLSKPPPRIKTLGWVTAVSSFVFCNGGS